MGAAFHQNKNLIHSNNLKSLSPIVSLKFISFYNKDADKMK